MKFDDPNVGQQAIQCSQYKNTYRNAVPLQKIEVNFFVQGRHGSEVTRLHKVQGLTLDTIVIDMNNSSAFSAGQAYVAFSRVKSFSGLFIKNFNEHAIKKSDEVHEEMTRKTCLSYHQYIVI